MKKEKEQRIFKTTRKKQQNDRLKPTTPTTALDVIGPKSPGIDYQTE